MRRWMSVALALTVSLGSALSAQQRAPGPIRASLEREASRWASTVVSQTAQPATASAPDNRIRITLWSDRESKITGVVDRIDAQAVTIIPERGPARTVPLTAIQKAERPNGKRSRGAQAFVGTMIGMAAGFTAARVGYDGCAKSSYLCELDNYVAQLYGFTAGGVSGGLIGGFVVPSQRWRRVPLSEISVAGPTVVGPLIPAR